jgi:hypothetical protein
MAAQGVDHMVVSTDPPAGPPLGALAAADAPVPPPASHAALLEAERRLGALRAEHRAQARVLAEYRRRSVEHEQRAAEASKAASAMEAIRAQLLPMVARLKRRDEEDKIWDDALKLRFAVGAARAAGIADAKLAHLVARADALERGEAFLRKKDAAAAARRQRDASRSPQRGAGPHGRAARLRSAVEVSRAEPEEAAAEPTGPDDDATSAGLVRGVVHGLVHRVIESRGEPRGVLTPRTLEYVHGLVAKSVAHVLERFE